jgi:hypothetical protein
MKFISAGPLSEVKKELIRHVIECCDTGAQNKNLLIFVSKATEREAKYCKVSQCT